MKRNRIIRGFFILLAAAALISVASFGVMSLWNWLMPALFHLPAITAWQALGLLVLCRLLFGGFRGHRAHWRRRMRERWNHMSPAEREQFQAGLSRACGPWPCRETGTAVRA